MLKLAANREGCDEDSRLPLEQTDPPLLPQDSADDV